MMGARAAIAAEVTIRRATPADADEVCRKLAETFSNATEAQRRVHFDVPWPHPADGYDYGVIAEYRGRIVGFASIFTSDRQVGNRRVLVYNLSSWWVDPEFRGASVAKVMLNTYLPPRVHAVNTILTAPEHKRGFWGRQTVHPFEHARRVYVFPGLRARAWMTRPRLLPRGRYPADLGSEAIRILKDHADLRCQVLVFEHKGRHCGFITRRRSLRVEAEEWPSLSRRLGELLAPRSDSGALRLQRARVSDLLVGELPCAEIFYVSDPELFRQHFWAIGRHLARRQRAVAVLGDADRLGVPHAWGRPVPSDYFVWEPCPLPDHQVDCLYSEFFVLAIGQESR
jgi:GNAT superfamily N-acetyltransferase